MNFTSYKATFGVEKRFIDYCSPGCIDYYYDDLQYFNGETSRPRERLFFSNYTHLANKLYPLPTNLKTVYRPMLGTRAVAGDARKQATNFTKCPDFWNVFKIEAAVYPIDDNFNMCGDEAFYKQSAYESIDCAFTERVGYFFITVGAVTIGCMYFLWFAKVFLTRAQYFEKSQPRDEFDIFKLRIRGKISLAFRVARSLGQESTRRNIFQFLVFHPFCVEKFNALRPSLGQSAGF